MSWTNGYRSIRRSTTEGGMSLRLVFICAERTSEDKSTKGFHSRNGPRKQANFIPTLFTSSGLFFTSSLPVLPPQSPLVTFSCKTA